MQSDYPLRQPSPKILRPDPVTIVNLDSNLRRQELKTLIKDCRKGKTEAQEALYKAFYGYAMAISLRYTKSREQAEEVVNDGFLKVFTHIDSHNPGKSFKSWLRRIMINTAIDHHRKHEKHENPKDIEQVYDHHIPSDSLEQLSEQELIQLIQLLPPAYRMSFNLYAIEGYKHHEIAEKLGITVGTSKSNLAKARKHLRRMLRIVDQENEEAYG